MWKELVAAVSVMVSKGKTMASDGMEVDFGKGWCRGAKGTLGFRHIGYRVRVKMREGFDLKQGNIATFGGNVVTFQRGKQPTSRR